MSAKIHVHMSHIEIHSWITQTQKCNCRENVSTLLGVLFVLQSCVWPLFQCCML